MTTTVSDTPLIEATSVPHVPPPLLRIRPRPGWVPVDFAEMWHYRELLGFFAVRDVKVRYKQTLLGVAWAVIQPVMTMLAFTILFHGLLGVVAEDSKYHVFAFCALLPWQLFAYALTQSSNSLVASERLITKIYFPRLILPLASVISGLVDFAIAFVILLGMMAWYGIVPGMAILMLPLFALLALAAALAIGLWLSALNVQFRDVRHTIPFLTQFWLFITPVAYPSSKVPEAWRAVYGLNPMAGVVEGFRWALLGTAEPPGMVMVVSVTATLVLLVGGLFYFRRMEKSFADVL
ncbi:MAG: ABC transporter permease [Tepidisphaeraceae bacterium]